MLPSISVVIPCRNMAGFLHECLQSLEQQDYSRLDVIVIDGASSDDTVSVIQAHRSVIRYWVSEPDGGQSHAINKGVAVSGCDLVSWLNADDYLLPGAIQTVARAWESNPRAPFYFGDGIRVGEKGEAKSGFVPGGVVRFDRQALELGLNYILQPSTFMCRRSMTEVGCVDEGLNFGMDWDLWLKLSKLGEPMPLQGQLSASREYATTKTSTGGLVRIEELRRIAERHTGRTLTPGVLCYMMDELSKRMDESADLFPSKSKERLLDLWAATSTTLKTVGAGPDGFPRG